VDSFTNRRLIAKKVSCRRNARTVARPCGARRWHQSTCDSEPPLLPRVNTSRQDDAAMTLHAEVQSLLKHAGSSPGDPARQDCMCSKSTVITVPTWYHAADEGLALRSPVLHDSHAAPRHLSTGRAQACSHQSHGTEERACRLSLRCEKMGLNARLSRRFSSRLVAMYSLSENNRKVSVIIKIVNDGRRYHGIPWDVVMLDQQVGVCV